MEDTNINSKLFAMYMIILILMLFCGTAFSQVQISYFNADWNKANGVEWIDKLKDVNTISYIDIAKQSKLASEYKDDEEVARFQADLSFKMTATKEEVQEEIDSQMMSDF
mgnify:CR=1 FL=1